MFTIYFSYELRIYKYNVSSNYDVDLRPGRPHETPSLSWEATVFDLQKIFCTQLVGTFINYLPSP
jgi:hypothetical protein